MSDTASSCVNHIVTGVSSSGRGSQIIIAEVDLFDFSEGEPPENYLTILRALEVRVFRSRWNVC